MTFQVKHASTWKNATPKAKHSGTWKSVQKIWAKAAGVWTEVWANFAVNLPGASDADTAVSPSSASSGFRVARNGEISRQSTGAYLHDWAIPKSSTVGDGYDMRINAVSGSSPTGLTLGAWYSLDTLRTFEWARSGIGVTSGTVQVQIRDDTTLVVLGSGNYSGSSEVTL